MSVTTAEPALTARLRDVLAAYHRARHEMEMYLGAGSAGAVVAGMHRGAWPRRGQLSGDLEYFVHGIGYTVVLPSGAQVHVDADDAGDSLTVADLMMFFRTADAEPPASADLEKALRQITREGGLRKAKRGKYLLP